jgi:predicted transcriptional regulator
MSNYFEYRLHQISILLHAFEKEEAFTDEYQQLLDERNNILKQLDITE